MRSSKQRSRNKQNRNARPSGGNVINRVFDSSGPEGKVRGTPAQIIEKYGQLHRDAQLSGDRVNAENFAQHAEHYTRMLAEATREVDRAREEQESFARERQTERDRQMEAQRDRDRERTARLRAQEEANGADGPQAASQPPRQEQRHEPRHEPRAEPRPESRAEPRGHDLAGASFLSQPMFPVVSGEDDDEPLRDAGLVDTPEERRAPTQPRSERPRREERRPWPDDRRPEAAPAAAPPDAAPAATADALPAEKPRRARKPRAPRPDAAAVATDAAE